MFFSQDWRERIKNENPDAGFGEYPLYMRLLASLISYPSFLGEVGKLLGAKWKELDEEEKKVIHSLIPCAKFQYANTPPQPYVELAAKDKTRAEDEKAVYDVRTLLPPNSLPLLTCNLHLERQEKCRRQRERRGSWLGLIRFNLLS